MRHLVRGNMKSNHKPRYLFSMDRRCDVLALYKISKSKQGFGQDCMETGDRCRCVEGSETNDTGESLLQERNIASCGQPCIG